MKLHRDLGISQPAAWFMLQLIREAFCMDRPSEFDGPVEVDEAYLGSLEKNKHEWKNANLGHGPAGKTAVVGMKDRETGQIKVKVVEDTSGPMLNSSSTTIQKSEPRCTRTRRWRTRAMTSAKHEAIKHSVNEYVKGMAHTNSVESFWAMLKRAGWKPSDIYGVLDRLTSRIWRIP